MFIDLPLELMMLVLCKLDFIDIGRISLTCKTLNSIIEALIQDSKFKLNNGDLGVVLNPSSYFKICIIRNQIINIQFNRAKILTKPTIFFELKDYGLDVINVYDLKNVICCGKPISMHSNIEDFFDLSLNNTILKRNIMHQVKYCNTFIIYATQDIKDYSDLPKIIKTTAVNHIDNFDKSGIQGIAYMNIDWRNIIVSKEQSFNNPRYVAFLYDRCHLQQNYIMNPTHLFVCYSVFV